MCRRSSGECIKTTCATFDGLTVYIFRRLTKGEVSTLGECCEFRTAVAREEGR